MAHIVVWTGNQAVAHLFRELFESYEEERGHLVTTCDGEDFWQLLAVLRSSLHPCVVILGGDGWLHHLGAEEDQALAANVDALRQHRYIEIRWWASVPATSPAQVLYAHCHVQVIPGPFDIDEVIAAVNAAEAAQAELTAMSPAPRRKGFSAPAEHVTEEEGSALWRTS